MLTNKNSFLSIPVSPFLMMNEKLKVNNFFHLFFKNSFAFEECKSNNNIDECKVSSNSFLFYFGKNRIGF